ncbi:extracellular solute-binding protein [Paenibacillus sp. J5C_2022]|uniref:extracellular solute-binding protein n=1 Tax=Paenibacillus sp. J5C2022 TaxID=2977129 RepID=UPI0021D10402|nr:extracellular solute-binding protein [Paenibacillus sp. J5C2022]MCU6712796.1 extracellular solute-binding protein [Paenibacillus sp. J5C2022]
MKKSMMIALASVMVVSALAGCSSGGNEPAASEKPAGQTQGNASGEGGKKNDSPAKEKNTFTMLVESHPNWPYDKEWVIWDLIEENTGASFEVTTPSGKLDDTVNLTISSGTMPDVMFMGNRDMANKYGQQGALVNILEYTDMMPNFAKWLEQYPEVAQSQLAADGKMYMFPNEGFGETNRQIWIHRDDVFQKHGLKEPETFDELLEVLRVLKKEYPDSYPFTFRFGPNLMILRNLAAHFGTHDTYYMDNGEIKYGPIEDNYKKMLEYLNTMYKEGLIPPDWLTVDTKKWQDMLSTNKAFVTVDYIGRVDFFNLAMRAEMPEYTMKFMTPPIGLPDGEALNYNGHVVNSGLTVASTSKKIESFMKVMDFFYSEEGRIMSSWGKEGETFKNESGQKQFLGDYKEITELRKSTGLATNGTYTWIDYDAHLSLASDELKAAYEGARQYDAPYRPKAELNEQELEVNTTVGEQIQKYQQENVTKFILGDKDFSEWEGYVEGLKKLGLEQMMDIQKSAFERAKNVSLK